MHLRLTVSLFHCYLSSHIHWLTFLCCTFCISMITIWLINRVSGYIPSPFWLTVSRSTTSPSTSKIAQSLCWFKTLNTTDHRLEVFLNVYMIAVVKCISKLTQLPPPRKSLEFTWSSPPRSYKSLYSSGFSISLYPSFPIHCQSHSILASQFISMFPC